MPQKNNSKRNILIGTVILVGLFFIISYLPLQRSTLEFQNSATSTTATSTLPRPVDPKLFSNISIRAKAAYVYDLTNDQVIFAKNENAPFPLASITKLMTALVSSNILSDNSEVTVSSSSLATYGESGLSEGERWNFKDLRDFTLMISSNDGAHALREASNEKLNGNEFVQQMNAEASTINLSTLHFLNESGLDIDSTETGGVGSAKDVAGLLEYLIKNKPSIIEITKYSSHTFKSLSGISHRAYNTDEDLALISHIIASKTGFTALAGGNLVVAYNPSLNHPVIIVLLGSTQSGRFSDMISLASSTSAYLRGE